MQWRWWMARPLRVEKTRRQLMHSLSLGFVVCMLCMGKVTGSMHAVNGEMSAAAAEEDVDIVVGVGGAMVMVDVDCKRQRQKL